VCWLEGEDTVTTVSNLHPTRRYVLHDSHGRYVLTLGVSNVKGLNLVSNESASIYKTLAVAQPCHLLAHRLRNSYHGLQSLFPLILSFLPSSRNLFPLRSCFPPTKSTFRIFLRLRHFFSTSRAPKAKSKLQFQLYRVSIPPFFEHGWLFVIQGVLYASSHESHKSSINYVDSRNGTKFREQR